MLNETAELGRDEARITLPEEARARFRLFREHLTDQSTIVWGEHCTECAFPSCYATCAFYTPRQDFHCRRFAHGIERVVETADPRLELRRIEFRRWGKLEGQGPLGLRPTWAARGLTRLDDAATTALRAVPDRWAESLVWRLNSKKHDIAGGGRPLRSTDHFVVEAWHDGPEPIPMTLTLLPSVGALDQLYQEAISLAPGYSRTAVPVERIAQQIDLSRHFRIQLEPIAEAPPPIVFGVIDFVCTDQPVSSESMPGPTADRPARPLVKCVVWDLDNTAWSGTLAEDGVEGVTPIPEVVDAIKALDARGILNSIASKNDREPALEALTRFGLIDYFVFPQISWNPKSDAIRQIAADIDIGTDTFVFIDDQPFERGEIQTFHPEVEVLPETAVGNLLEMPRFAVPVTAESAKRRLMYKTEEERQTAYTSSGASYHHFLKDCDIRLTVAPLSSASLVRVYELSQRTNQLNTSGRRYTREELDAMLADNAADTTFVLSCADRFGEYGIIGFCVLSSSNHDIDSFFMSCRVQRKRVENAFFSLLGAELAKRGVDSLRVNFRKTAKNSAVSRMLSELGFTYEPGEEEGRGLFVRPVSQPFPETDVVAVERRSLPEVAAV